MSGRLPERPRPGRTFKGSSRTQGYISEVVGFERPCSVP